MILRVTFSISPATKSGDTDAKSMLQFVFKGIGTTLIDIENAPLDLRAFRIAHFSSSDNSLLNKIMRHYTKTGLSQVWKTFCYVVCALVSLHMSTSIHV